MIEDPVEQASVVGRLQVEVPAVAGRRQGHRDPVRGQMVQETFGSWSNKDEIIVRVSKQDQIHLQIAMRCN